MLDPKKKFLWTAALVDNVAAVNPRGSKILLANHVGRFSINGKPAVINDLWKLTNRPFWLLIFLVVSFGKIPLFSES